MARRSSASGGVTGPRASSAGREPVLSCRPVPSDGALDLHEAYRRRGQPIDAAWLATAATALQAERDAEQERIAAEAHAAAATRLLERIAAGFDPNDSLIEKIRSRLDIAQTLAAHGYDRSGDKWRHPNSASGAYGADIKAFGGIERVFSHNATDPSAQEQPARLVLRRRRRCFRRGLHLSISAATATGR